MEKSIQNDYYSSTLANVIVIGLKIEELHNLVRTPLHYAIDTEKCISNIELVLTRELLTQKDNLLYFSTDYNSKDRYKSKIKAIEKAECLINTINKETETRDLYENTANRNDWYKKLIKRIKNKNKVEEDICSLTKNKDHHYPHYVCKIIHNQILANDNITAFSFISHKLQTNYDMLYAVVSNHKIWADNAYLRTAIIFGGVLQEDAKNQSLTELKRTFKDKAERWSDNENEPRSTEITPFELAKLYNSPVLVKKEYSNKHKVCFTADGKVWTCCPISSKSVDTPKGDDGLYEITKNRNEIEFIKRLDGTLPECFLTYMEGKFSEVIIEKYKHAPRVKS